MCTIEAHRQAGLRRLVAACQTDPRVVAAFLGCSYAREAVDAYSNLDVGVITSDAAYDDFFADHQALIRKLGAPVFLETFRADGVDGVCFTLADGVDGEVVLGRQTRLIVCTQMTKSDVLTCRRRREDVADLDITICDDHAINEQFDQLAALVEGGACKSALYALTEARERARHLCEGLLPVHLRLHLLLPLLQDELLTL
jgi:hypothetical protein